MRIRKTPNLPPLAPTWPGALTEFQNEVIYAANEEERESIRFHIAALASQPEKLELLRGIVNSFGLHQRCARAACRRAHACIARYANCLMENRAALRELLGVLIDLKTGKLSPERVCADAAARKAAVTR